MGYPRSKIVSKEEPGVYHITTTCARKAYLCGYDALTNRDYEHRKGWIEERMIFLTEFFPVDIFSYGIMSNHYHMVLFVQPQLVQTWTDEEVARRWVHLSSAKKYLQSDGEDLKEKEIRRILTAPAELKELRERLSDLSWFMKSLNEYIARKANKEDNCTGSFWEKRYHAQSLLVAVAILVCMIYVDLNPIRAKVQNTPETSKFTGAYERIKALKSKKEQKAKHLLSLKESPLDLTDLEYLSLLDWTGRQIRVDKPGHIPHELPPILERLQINQNHWPKTIESYGENSRAFFGTEPSMREMAHKLNKKWCVGVGFSKLAFLS